MEALISPTYASIRCRAETHAPRVLARRANSSTADERTLNQSAVLLDSPMGSSSGLDLKTSPRSQLKIQLQTLYKCSFRQHPIPLFASSLLNHGKCARTKRIISRTLLYIHTLTRAPPLPILRGSLNDAYYSKSTQLLRVLPHPAHDLCFIECRI